jgi:hypothetical protein
VRVLLDLFVERVTEADRRSEVTDGVLRARQEVPSRGCVGPVVAVHVGLLLLCGQGRSFLRVDADRDDVELASGVEGQDPERADGAVEDLRTEHRTLVVAEHQDDRTLPEVLAEPHIAAGFVFEDEIERDLLVQPLVDADLFQQAGLRRCRRAGFRRRGLRARGSRRGRQHARQPDRRYRS